MVTYPPSKEKSRTTKPASDCRPESSFCLHEAAIPLIFNLAAHTYSGYELSPLVSAGTHSTLPDEAPASDVEIEAVTAKSESWNQSGTRQDVEDWFKGRPGETMSKTVRDQSGWWSGSNDFLQWGK
jgi:hypothetical protein